MQVTSHGVCCCDNGLVFCGPIRRRLCVCVGSGGTLQVRVKLPSIKTLAIVIMVWFSVVQYDGGCVCVGSGGTL